MTDYSDLAALAGNVNNDKGTDPLHVNRLRPRLYTGRAIADIPEPGWIIDGILPAESFILPYGPKGNGKSFVIVDMSMSIATGQPWAGRQVRQGTVLFVISEGASGMGRRQAAWLEHHHVNGDYPVIWLPRRVNLTDDGQVAELVDIATTEQPVLVVIDTLNRCSLGADENSPKDMGRIVESLDRIRDTGTAVAPVHHAGKNLSQGPRGHTALLGAADAVFQITGSDRRIHLLNEWQKDAEPAGPIDFKMVDAARSVALDAYDAAVSAPESVGVVLRVLDEIATPDGIAPGKWEEACKEAGVSRATFWRAKKYLNTTNQIDNMGTIDRPKYVRHFEADDRFLSEVSHVSRVSQRHDT
jgi:hypothetical protein